MKGVLIVPEQEKNQKMMDIANSSNARCHKCGAASGLRYTDTGKGVTLKRDKATGKMVCMRCGG